MKKLLIPALGLILMGQGCFAPAPEVADDSMMGGATSMMVPAPGHEGVDEMIVDDSNNGAMLEDDDGMMEGDENGAMMNDSESKAITMEVGNFFFDPDTMTASPGETIKITFSEVNGFHTFVLDDINFKDKVVEGNTISFTAPDKPGTYAFYCDIGNHQALGMEGVLTVK